MAIGRDGHRLSSLAGCIARAAEFALTESEARAIADHQRAVVERDFGAVLHAFALGG